MISLKVLVTSAVFSTLILLGKKVSCAPAVSEMAFRKGSDNGAQRETLAGNEPLLFREVRQGPVAASPSLSSLLPALLLLMGEAGNSDGVAGAGGGLGGFGGYPGRGGGSSDGFRRGKRDITADASALRAALQAIRPLTDGQGNSAIEPQLDRFVRSLPLRFTNDNTWTEVIPLLRKLQAKNFASANPVTPVGGKVTGTSTGAASCAKPVVSAGPSAVFG